MANYAVSDSNLTSIADAIRTKGGTSAGLSFPDGFVSAIGAIPTGGGGSTLITKSITVNGTYNASDDSADGYSQVTVNVPEPSVPFVTGTFTGLASEKDTAKAITIPYTGGGYPIAGIIFPASGTYNSSSDFYAAVQQNVSAMVSFAKAALTTPDYDVNDEKNNAAICNIYKSSSSNANSYTRNSGMASKLYNQVSAASNSSLYIVRFSSATNMTVYIASDTSYGFMAGVEYTYVIAYSA